jgi:uncharacterized SAM-binding protein YcdF (DUF218 family)
MSRPYRYGAGILLLAVTLGVLGATYPRLLLAMAQWLDVGVRPQQADYVMVLNGGEGSRPFAAAALFKAGLAPHVLVAKTYITPKAADGLVPPYHELNRRVLLNRGVPATAITLLPGAAATTFDEARALAIFLAERPHARVLVVTNDYHARRSRWIFARTLADRAGQIELVSAPSDDLPKDGWWQDEEGFVAVLSEYLKLAFYVVRYGHFRYWLAACIALLLVSRWVRRRESRLPAPAY